MDMGTIFSFRWTFNMFITVTVVFSARAEWQIIDLHFWRIYKENLFFVFYPHQLDSDWVAYASAKNTIMVKLMFAVPRPAMRKMRILAGILLLTFVVASITYIRHVEFYHQPHRPAAAAAGTYCTMQKQRSNKNWLKDKNLMLPSNHNCWAWRSSNHCFQKIEI